MQRNNIEEFRPPSGVHGLAPEKIPSRLISVAPVRFNAHMDWKTCGCGACQTMRDPEFAAACAAFGVCMERLRRKYAAGPIVAPGVIVKP